MIDPQTVRDFMAGFYGYGHLRATYWFVGLEEGGNREDVEKRIHAWDELGRPFLADVREFHRLLGGTNWFGTTPPLQRTWRSLIRSRFAAEGVSIDASALKKYQSMELASPLGDTALIELLPLPSRRKADWNYASLGLAELASRDAYETLITPRRREQIIKLIDIFQPFPVVTYGDSATWRQALTAKSQVNGKAWATRRGKTIVVCTYHPEGARSNDHWDEIGRYIARATRQTVDDV